jgi:hypothetical protein
MRLGGDVGTDELDPLKRKAALAKGSSRILAGACLLVALVALLLVYYRTDKSQQALEILQDCTIPHHACYDQGHKTTDKAISSINKVSILAAYCAKRPNVYTVPQIEHCVLIRLK